MNKGMVREYVVNRRECNQPETITQLDTVSTWFSIAFKAHEHREREQRLFVMLGKGKKTAEKIGWSNSPE